MIHVVAIITTKPGQRDLVLQLFRANRPNVLAEEGCIEYDAAIDSQPVLGNQTPLGRDSLAVIEKWASIAALQAHFKTPHMAAYAEQVRDLIASRSIHMLSGV